MTTAILGFFDSDKPTRAEELWAWFHITAEDYDLTVCSARVHGVAMPATPTERQLSQRFAAEKLQEIKAAREWEGIPLVDFNQGKMAIDRMMMRTSIDKLRGIAKGPRAR